MPIDKRLLALDEWYRSELGSVLADSVTDHLRTLLSTQYGYHCLQVGLPEHTQWLEAVPIRHKICLNPYSSKCDSLLAGVEEWPLMDNSMDVVLLPHTLELSREPEIVLREVNRVLIAHGRVVFIGFNPYSLWGLRKWFWRRKTHPWLGRWHSPLGLERLLDEHSLEITKLKSFFYRPPSAKQKSLGRWRFLETFGRMTWPYPGGIYIAIAKKSALKITPIRPLWKFRNFVVGKSLAN